MQLIEKMQIPGLTVPELIILALIIWILSCLLAYPFSGFKKRLSPQSASTLEVLLHLQIPMIMIGALLWADVILNYLQGS